MGDSGSNDDTSSTAEDFNSLEVTDPGPPSGGDDNNNQGTTFGVSLGPGQGSVSATGSTAQDVAIGFTDGQGGAGVNFEAFGGITNNQGDPVGKTPQSPSQFANALNATQGGDSAPSVSVPTVQAAGISPTFAQSASIFDQDLGTMTGRRDTAPKGLETGVMAPEQRGTPSFTPFGDETIVQSFLPAAVQKVKPQTQQERGLQAVANMFAQGRDRKAGMGDPRGIDFGVTAPVASTVGDDFGPALDMVDARTQAERAKAQDPDANIDPFVSFDVTGRPGTTATGVEDPFDPNVGKPFDVERLEQMERLQEPTLLERAGIPSVLGALDPERISKDRMATAIALGRPVGVLEGFNFTAPNMAKDKETIEEYNKRINARIPDSQLIKDNSGMVIGIRDAIGRLVEGVDPNAQEQRSDDNETQAKKKTAKKPDDPCPEGYMLIDGKCTIIEDPSKGTGFLRFPTDRDPPFKKGPFTPSTVATGTGGIRALNPITFNNPFRT